MHDVLKIGPLTRVEGHLEVEVTVDPVGGKQQIVDAKCAGTNYRGFENLLKGRDPRDAVHYTQRICGVCPISHGQAASAALESAMRVTVPANGRILRNLILGANFLQSHILHFYHLAAPDYINTDGRLPMSPWMPHYSAPDMVGGATASVLVDHYVQALSLRRKAHQMGAIFAGRMPTTVSFEAGGCTSVVTSQAVSAFRTILTQIRGFLTIMSEDVQQVAMAFPAYSSIGRGCGNLLAYGVFDLNAAGTSKLLARGRYTNGAAATVDATKIREYVRYAWYTPASGNLPPSSGETQPKAGKAGAYSWIKAPRYANAPHEVGPLARMWVNGDYRKGISVIDRIAARAAEARKVADAMDAWLTELQPGKPVFVTKSVPSSGTAMGLTEAPRGALGHWTRISSKKTARYQVVTPTGWNASPMDDSGVHGPIEQALIGTPVADLKQPIEVLRIVHSFDPCLSCSVHMLRPGRKTPEMVVRI